MELDLRIDISLFSARIINDEFIELRTSPLSFKETSYGRDTKGTCKIGTNRVRQCYGECREIFPGLGSRIANRHIQACYKNKNGFQSPEW